MHLPKVLAWSNLYLACSAAIHHVFVGNLYTPASLHLLEFNDEAKSLKKIQTFAADAPHSWIQLDHTKENLYGSSLSSPRIASYEVSGPTSVKLTRSAAAGGACSGKSSPFVLPMSKDPYYVFEASWPAPSACGASLSIYANGTVKETADSWKYASESGIHGLALGERGAQALLYSADLNGDSVWTHSLDKATGKMKELGRLKMSQPGMHPRHLVAHPNGTYLYVVMEAENKLHQFDLDAKTGLPIKDNQSYSLIPSGKFPHQGTPSKNYWSASVGISPSGRYLWATSRGQMGNKANGNILGFLLGEDGAIAKQMFMNATPSGGVTSNAISPAFWNDDYAVFTEATNGHVEVVKMAGKRSGVQGSEYTALESVAKITIPDGGCCANAIWYS